MAIRSAPFTYSSSDSSSRSSCDHSQLRPTPRMSMHGRGIASSSWTWTVLSSSTRPPASHERTMFCASWVCGPAAGPNGTAARRPPSSTERSWQARPRTKRRTGRSKIAPFSSTSRKTRRTREARGSGRRIVTRFRKQDPCLARCRRPRRSRLVGSRRIRASGAESALALATRVWVPSIEARFESARSRSIPG